MQPDPTSCRACARCRRVMPIDQFPLRRKDGTKRHGHCVDCKAAYQREWYARNRERHRERTAVNRRAERAKNKELVREAKRRPCADCGGTFPPYVMDFDHVRGRKVGNVAHLKMRASPKAVVAEIAKCDVVCANCHRIRSHDRLRATPPEALHVAPPPDVTDAPRQMTWEWVAGGSNSEPWA